MPALTAQAVNAQLFHRGHWRYKLPVRSTGTVAPGTEATSDPFRGGYMQRRLPICVFLPFRGGCLQRVRAPEVAHTTTTSIMLLLLMLSPDTLVVVSPTLRRIVGSSVKSLVALGWRDKVQAIKNHMNTYQGEIRGCN